MTRQGEVVDETTFRYNTARKEHRTHVREMMTQAVVNKTLELEVNKGNKTLELEVNRGNNGILLRLK